MTQTHTVEPLAPDTTTSSAQIWINKIQLSTAPYAIAFAMNGIVQLIAGLAVWFARAAFLCLTDAGLAMAGDMTLMVLSLWNIIADVLHLPRAPYFPS